MSSIRQCLDQVTELRIAAKDPAAAYLVRSRLERLILSCARAAALDEGSSPPDLPGSGLEPSHTASPTTREVVLAASTLYRASSDLCRPSESLDARWEAGWLRVENALDDLEACLTRHKASGVAAA